MPNRFGTISAGLVDPVHPATNGGRPTGCAARPPRLSTPAGSGWSSGAHGNNQKSIRLHRLLGFRKVGMNGEKVRFEVAVER